MADLGKRPVSSFLGTETEPGCGLILFHFPSLGWWSSLANRGLREGLHFMSVIATEASRTSLRLTPPENLPTFHTFEKKKTILCEDREDFNLELLHHPVGAHLHTNASQRGIPWVRFCSVRERVTKQNTKNKWEKKRRTHTHTTIEHWKTRKKMQIPASARGYHMIEGGTK